ncbi:hypothetical protein QTP88_011746 [Uroleucon formosanum]
MINLDKRNGTWPGKPGDLRFGTWNIRTLYKPGALHNIIQITSNYRTEITALQEIRWPGNGILESGNSTILYSGTKNQKHENGVGFIVKNSMVNSVKKFEPISDRLCYLQISGKVLDVVFINCYAPTENCITIIVGDLNAQVGREEIFQRTAGKESLHLESNSNGIRLISFAASKDLIISSTQLQRKEIHKHTWTSPGGRFKSQIDHILINRRHRNCITQVRSCRGAYGDTDHYLVTACFKVKLSRVWNKRMKSKPKLDTEKFRDPETRRNFQLLTNNLLKNEPTSLSKNIENKWKEIKETVNRAAEIFKGNIRKPKNSWFNDLCKDAINKRSEARSKAIQNPTPENQEEFLTLRNRANKIIRREKRKAEKEFVSSIEEHRLNPRRFFKKCNSIKKGFNAQLTMLKDDCGHLITDEANIVKKFRVYFKDLLNINQDNNVPEEVHPLRYTVQPEITEPDEEELKLIIKMLKNNKAPGEDNINAELFKISTPKMFSEIYTLIKEIWKKEQIPQDWKMAIICPIYKKGGTMDTKNYRGIALLNTCYKILSTAILHRLEIYSKDIIGKYQTGFIKGISTTDHIFTIRQALEKYYEFEKEVHLCFVDFSQAYDSINRNKLWITLEEFEMPSKLIRLIKECNSNTACKVKFRNQLSESFDVNTGLRQGDALSPLLFNLALEKVVRTMPAYQDMELLGEYSILAYADDNVVMGNTRIEVTAKTDDLLKAAKCMGLKVNQDKTKYMVVSRKNEMVAALSVGEYTFEAVNDFKYLGTNINKNNNMHNEIKLRISAANKGFFALVKLFKSKLLSKKSKINLYLSYLRPVLAYGCETWSVTKGDEEKLLIFERKILRRIYGPIYENGDYRIRTNGEIYQLFQKPNIKAFIRSKRLEWAGHLWRANGICKQVLMGRINGRRPRGRPRHRWMDTIKSDLAKIAPETELAGSENREKWQEIVKAAKALNGL